MSSSAIEQLFAEVYANPGDDQLRRVLSDALIAIDDPRGELILHQLEPAKDYHRRAMRLIQAHGLSWLGPLRGKVIPLAYERGFLSAVSLLTGVGLPDFEQPIWGTVHTIELGQLAEHELSRIQITPAMKSLKAMTGVFSSYAIALRRRSLNWMHLLVEVEHVDPAAEHYDAADE